jgi:two-component system, NarL family, sensor histidine kinase DevS
MVGKSEPNRYERLFAAGLAIFSEHALDGVLQRVADAAREVIGARYAALGVLSEDGGSLSQFVTSGLSQAERKRIGALPTGHGLLGLLIREAKPIRVPDIRRHPRRFGFPPHHPSMKSFLGVPVAGRERVFGNLYLTEKIGAKEFDAEDERIAVLLARQVAVAVENARLSEQSQLLVNQVQLMQRQRDLFFAMMNHELRNALTGVYGWAERLVRLKPQGDAVAHASQEVYECAEETITLLNNFLDLTRLEAGKVRPVWQDVDVRVAVGRVIENQRPSAEAKQLVLEARYDDGVSRVRTDPVRVAQILTNLLSNAIRHSPNTATVTLRVSAQTADVSFHVIDHGPGIPADALQRIFEPFERSDPHSGQGAGLGLPVSRRLAKVLGGRLTVDSVVGRGATFTLTLPPSTPGL